MSVPKEDGSKYRKLIGSNGVQITVDVYDVINAYKVTCPARGHALKKLLAAGQRGGKTERQDLEEAIVSIKRSIELLQLVLKCPKCNSSLKDKGSYIRCVTCDFTLTNGSIASDGAITNYEEPPKCPTPTSK